MGQIFKLLTTKINYFTLAKYGSALAVISYICFSIYSSYTLREEIGILKQQLETSQQTNINIVEQVKKNNEALKELSVQRQVVIMDINELRKVKDEEFFKELYNRLYNSDN